MEYILVFWTIVGHAGTNTSTFRSFDWRPIGDFKTEASCIAAARHLNIPTDKFRCLKK